MYSRNIYIYMIVLLFIISLAAICRYANELKLETGTLISNQYKTIPDIPIILGFLLLFSDEGVLYQPNIDPISLSQQTYSATLRHNPRMVF